MVVCVCVCVCVRVCVRVCVYCEKKVVFQKIGRQVWYYQFPKLSPGLVDLEKASDRVPREVIRWAMCKLEVEKWLILTVIPLYTPSSLASAKSRMVYSSGTGLPRLSWKKGC